jgi:hypothetical protein
MNLLYTYQYVLLLSFFIAVIVILIRSREQLYIEDMIRRRVRWREPNVDQISAKTVIVM